MFTLGVMASAFDAIDVESLSDEDLTELASDLADLYDELSADEEFSAEDGEGADVAAAMVKVDAEFTRRAELAATAERTERAASFAEKFARKNAPAAAPEAPAAPAAPATAVEAAAKDDKDGDDDSRPETDTDHDGGNKEMGAITPAGLPAVGTDEAPVAASAKANKIVASADVPGFTPGEDLATFGADGAPSLKRVAEAMYAKRKHIRGTDKGADGYQYLVASVLGDYPEERTLGEDPHANASKIEKAMAAATGPKAVTASGGITVPLEPYYTLNILGVGDRPVKGALSNFAAARGGIRFITPPRLTDLSGSNAVITSAQDAAGYGLGLTPFKPFVAMSTGAEQDVTIYAVTRQLQFGNFGARTYPEQVEAWLNLSITAHARTAETQLLDQIKAASTSVTYGATYGAGRTLLPVVEQAVVAFRSRHRTGDNVRFRVLMPFWAKALIRTDIARQAFQQSYEVSDAQIEHWFDIRGVNVTWYIDGPTGAGQVFGAQSAGALLTYPTTVAWYLFVEGTMLFLDGGTLDLGLVRDSTLNSTNDYRIFVETFEAVAFVGVEAQYNVTTVVPNGAYPAGSTALSAPL